MQTEMWGRLAVVAALGLAMPAGLATPAVAQVAATPAQQQAAADFITRLSGDAFAVLRDKGLSKEQARTRFRDLLRQNFAVDEAGMRLIRRYRGPSSPVKLTPQQLEAYRAALPDFLVNTYSDRLYDFAAAKVAVVRTAPRGGNGDVDVFTRITDPKGGKPIDAVWQVAAGARPLVSNITVNGVNVSLTQEQDFSSYIQKNGFDALVDFMRKAK